MVQQIKSYKTLEVENNKVTDVEHVVGAKDKGKKKEVGIKIKEPTKVTQIHDKMPPSSI